MKTKQLAIASVIAMLAAHTAVRDTQALFGDHADNLKLETEVKIAAMPGYVHCFEGELSTYRDVRGH